MKTSRPRAGVACFEIQVSLVVLGIALAGICPLVVMQLKLLRRFESMQIGSDNFQIVRGQRMIDGVSDGNLSPPLIVLRPQDDGWVRRLGVAATFCGAVPPSSFSPVATESTINDNDAILSGNWVSQSESEAYQGDCNTLAAGSSGSASWTFPAITPGIYRVMISWPPSISIPSDAEFRFTNGSSSNVSVKIANGTTPISGGPWRDLGNRSLGASLTITLAGSSVGSVVADAVRIGPRNDVTISEYSPNPAGDTTVKARVVFR